MIRVEPLALTALGDILIAELSMLIENVFSAGKLEERVLLKRNLISKPSVDVVAPTMGSRTGGSISWRIFELLTTGRRLKLAASLPAISWTAMLSFCGVGSA